MSPVLALRPPIERVRAEYVAMPGMSLTAQQVQRLFGIEEASCQTLLDALVDARFLRVKPDGSYARLTNGGLLARVPRRQT